jgi:hypothetical protein
MQLFKTPCFLQKERKNIMWTEFIDMHSGGGQKEGFSHCFIEAPENEAKVIFYNRFGHNPERVTCTCCGGDYSIIEYETLEQATAYERNCEYGYFFTDNGEFAGKSAEFDQNLKDWCVSGKPVSGRWIEEQEMGKMEIREKCDTPESDQWGLYVPLEKYIQRDDVMVIRADEIEDTERVGSIPQQGYVWVE